MEFLRRLSGHKNRTVFGVRKIACALIRSSLLRRGSAREASFAQ